MITYLAWVVVTVSSSGQIYYSPPVRTLDDCQRLVIDNNNNSRAKCVQVNLFESK